MDTKIIKDLHRENKELRSEVVRLTSLIERLRRVCESYKERRDYWRGRYFEVVHNKVGGPLPDVLKDLFQ